MHFLALRVARRDSSSHPRLRRVVAKCSSKIRRSTLLHALRWLWNERNATSSDALVAALAAAMRAARARGLVDIAARPPQSVAPCAVLEDVADGARGAPTPSLMPMGPVHSSRISRRRRALAAESLLPRKALDESRRARCARHPAGAAAAARAERARRAGTEVELLAMMGALALRRRLFARSRGVATIRAVAATAVRARHVANDGACAAQALAIRSLSSRRRAPPPRAAARRARARARSMRCARRAPTSPPTCARRAAPARSRARALVPTLACRAR